MTKRQTHGLGRRGRIWDDGEGNLMATRYQTMSLELDKISQLSFVVALAVYDALAVIKGVAAGLRIKWPNDIVFDGRKLCGILISSESQAKCEVGVAIGIGINIQSAPTVTTYQTACLQQITKEAPTPDVLLQHIDKALDARLETWINSGFETISVDWLTKAYGRTEPVTLNTSNGPVTGQVCGLEPTGALQIKDSQGVKHFIFSAD
jgi:BirA family biotin operon repressor/biotin-[acetyl-CoA-carboxylase] ligase